MGITNIATPFHLVKCLSTILELIDIGFPFDRLFFDVLASLNGCVGRGEGACCHSMVHVGVCVYCHT